MRSGNEGGNLCVMPPLTAPVVPPGSLGATEQPRIRTGDLLLRPWAEADAHDLRAAFSDAAIQQWHARSIESREEAVDLIASYNAAWPAETNAHWAITGPDLIGRVALRGLDLSEGLAEIAYWVTPAARGRAAAPRAVIALSEWAFTDLGLHRLGLHHAVANTASCRVAEKAGFTYEGTQRSAALHPDGWHDMHQHARIQGDRGSGFTSGPRTSI